MTSPLSGIEAKVDNASIQTFLFFRYKSFSSYANQFIVEHDLYVKSRKVCMKTKSTPASVSVEGQDTKHTAVK